MPPRKDRQMIQAETARSRGAEPVRLRYRAPGSAMAQTHAAWRLPASHPDAHRLEQLRSHGYLSPRLYQNACAVLALWVGSGLGASTVQDYQPRERVTGLGDPTERTPEDELRALIAAGGVGMQAVLMLVRGDVMGAYMWQRCLRHLDTLDALAAKLDGLVWSADDH